MTWSAVTYPHHDGTLRLNLIGDLRGSAASLAPLIIHTMSEDPSDQLVVDLRAVHTLDLHAVEALMTGYCTAVEHGTSYRVVGAHGETRHLLQHVGVADVLTDNNDLGALILALLLWPAD